MGIKTFQGARNTPGPGSSPLPISRDMFAYLGNVETTLVNPEPELYTRLFIHIETAGIHLRPGDYTELGPFNATSDVDDVADTIVITGVEARMELIVERDNSLTHTVGGVEVTDDRLIYGPVQLSVATGVIVTGLSVDTNYWIAKPADAGVATDEVAFYLTEAAAKLAGTDNTDGRIALTDAIGTVNFAGMANNGLSTLPHAASITDGYSSYHIDGPIDNVVELAAADVFTIVGDGATADMTYWWAP